MTTTSELDSESIEPNDDGLVFESIPKELGILLVVAGIGGVLLPGPVGAPLLVMGGAVLYPKVFRKWDLAFQRRFPKIHRDAMRRVRRFVKDLEKRYPSQS